MTFTGKGKGIGKSSKQNKRPALATIDPNIEKDPPLEVEEVPFGDVSDPFEESINENNENREKSDDDDDRSNSGNFPLTQGHNLGFDIEEMVLLAREQQMANIRLEILRKRKS